MSKANHDNPETTKPGAALKPYKPYTHFALRCPACGDTWCEKLPLPVSVKMMASRLKEWASRCPMCDYHPHGNRKPDDQIVLLYGEAHEQALARDGVVIGGAA